MVFNSFDGLSFLDSLFSEFDGTCFQKIECILSIDSVRTPPPSHIRHFVSAYDVLDIVLLLDGR